MFSLLLIPPAGLIIPLKTFSERFHIFWNAFLQMSEFLAPSSSFLVKYHLTGHGTDTKGRQARYPGFNI